MNELKHHGIPGMKWGIRRYQNKDGSLTPAGKRREAKLDKQMAKQARKYNVLKSRKLTNKNDQNKETPPQKKTSKDMTLEELQSKTKRLNAEKDYLEAVKNRKAVEPHEMTTKQKAVEKGKAFAKVMWDDVIAPSATDTAKQVSKSYMVKYVNQILELDDEHKVYTNNKKKN